MQFFKIVISDIGHDNISSSSKFLQFCKPSKRDAQVPLTLRTFNDLQYLKSVISVIGKWRAYKYWRLGRDVKGEREFMEVPERPRSFIEEGRGGREEIFVFRRSRVLMFL